MDDAVMGGRKTKIEEGSMEREGVSQCRGRLLGWHMSSESLASEARQESFLAFGKRRVEQASKCAGVRHMRGPFLHFPP